MRTYSVNLKKLVRKTFKFLARTDVPKHWSKTKNERYDVHTMLVFYVLFCLADKSYCRFVKQVEPSVRELFGFTRVPCKSTLWYAWRRIPPRVLRHLVQLSGKGGRDKVGALDPTHFQISRPSVAFCKRIKRKLEREPNRKTTIVTGTRSLRILDAVIFKNNHRSGLDDIPTLMNEWVKGKTVHRTKGSRRKQLRRKWPGRSYRRRTLTETANSMLKRGMGETLRGRTVGQQARHFYAKCFTHNMLMRCSQ